MKKIINIYNLLLMKFTQHKNCILHKLEEISKNDLTKATRAYLILYKIYNRPLVGDSGHTSDRWLHISVC